jgi:hypothetical protein
MQLLLFAVSVFTNAEVLIVLSNLHLLKTNIVHTLGKTIWIPHFYTVYEDKGVIYHSIFFFGDEDLSTFHYYLRHLIA